MKVFLVWSGESSQALANVFYEWLPQVIQAIKPWMSKNDINKGAQWFSEIEQNLRSCHLGIICLTPENLKSPWIHFETGALAGKLYSKKGQKRVCTYLFKVEPNNLEPPLSEFQYTEANKEDTLKLMKTINNLLKDTDKVDDKKLEVQFDMWWPNFEGKISSIKEKKEPISPTSDKKPSQKRADPVIKIEKRRIKMAHSVKLKDNFFKPLLNKIGGYNDEYCKIDAQYSEEFDKMVPFKPKEPNNLQLYNDAMSHLKYYKHLLGDWEKLKRNTLKLNEKLAIIFEEIRVIVKKKIDLPFWCQRPFSDEKDEYLCPATFIRSIYEELENRLITGRKQLNGSGKLEPIIYGDKKIYHFIWGDIRLARSPNQEQMEKAQRLFSSFIKDERYEEKIKVFLAQKKETYNESLTNVKNGIGKIIDSIESENIIIGNCPNCQKIDF